MDVFERVAQATSLREGAAGVKSMLRAIHRNEGRSVRELARELGIPIPVLSAVRRELEKEQLLERGSGVALTSRGRALAEGALALPVRRSNESPAASRETSEADESLRPVLDALTRCFEERPGVDVRLDQTSCTPDTSLRRVLLMQRAGALEGRDILLLGDDDYVSLAIAALSQQRGSALARRVLVLDTDPRQIAHIERHTRAFGHPVECLRHDLRDPLPKGLQARFDIFETDPPYTRPGVELFLSRAIEGLRPEPGCQGFLSVGARSPDETLRMQRALASMGFTIRALLPGFNEYAGASILGGTSQLIHLETTRYTTALIPARPYLAPIYTGEQQVTTRVYRCTGCHGEQRVGQGETFETIEQLKSAGCPQCGNERFRRRGRSASAAVPESGRAEIRLATRDDLIEAARFESEIAQISFPEDPIVDIEFHRKKLEKAQGRSNEGMFVALHEGHVAGWLWVTLNKSFATGRPYANFRSLAVSPELRGGEVPKRLIEHAIGFAREGGAEWISGNVHVGNLGMRALYRAAGFAPKHLSMEYRLEAEERSER
jgi:predicted methyltransferase/ribosomal protein S18 acetylase RimI-like enzyme